MEREPGKETWQDSLKGVPARLAEAGQAHALVTWAAWQVGRYLGWLGQRLVFAATFFSHYGRPPLRPSEQQEIRQRHLRRTETLGIIAAGIGHEIGNPLFVIKTVAMRLMRLAGRDGAISRKQLTEISTSLVVATDHIASIVKSLNVVTRDSDGDALVATELRVILANVLELCSIQMRHVGIEFRADPLSESVVVACRPTQIAQIILNLLNNSFYAVKSLEAPWITISVKLTKTCVSISVADSGPKIPTNIHHKLMTPFFTTKGPQDGLGLGLSLSLGLAQEHGGDLRFDRAASNTTFTLCLPRYSGQGEWSPSGEGTVIRSRGLSHEC